MAGERHFFRRLNKDKVLFYEVETVSKSKYIERDYEDGKLISEKSNS